MMVGDVITIECSVACTGLSCILRAFDVRFT